jgi:cobalamin biosynthesis protein CobT
MLRPDLPKENVDGEALEWAADRIKSRPERKKILVVLSDGFEVSRYYANSTVVQTAEDLGKELITFLAGVLSHPIPAKR